jgi:prefoldin alpha subunit
MQEDGQRADRQWRKGKPILVPLTTSLYVPGTLADPDNVIVDVGTGFYVEKVRRALSFYIYIVT